MLHSASIVNKNKAYVFCGPSHAGKSTVSRFSDCFKLLSDDYIIIKRKDKKFFVYGTSLGGEYFKFGKELKPSNTSSELSKIFFLKKASSHRVEIKNSAEAMSELLKETFFCNDYSKESNSLLIKNFNLLQDLSRRVNCYNLYFGKNSGFWDKINKIK